MKILAIRGCNLASIEGDFEVDFRKEPLRSAGIFAITGNTGAGKTTILDAMCIALYKSSPRLSNVSKNVKVEDKITEGDIRTILRRGKAKGYAEVDFLAVDGCEYRVRWSISRARNKANGRLQDSIFDLTNLNTGEHRELRPLEHKVEIPRLIGLEYEQFTRAVLLAQGNFSAFLKADESDKAKMLETLTGTAIYSLISARIFAKTKEVKNELELLEAKRKALQLLSSEEIVTLNERRNMLSKDFGESKKRQIVLKEKNDWLARLDTLNRQIVQAEKQLLSAQEKLANAQPTIEKLKLIDSVQYIRDEYISLRGCKQQLADENSLLAKLEKELDEHNSHFVNACEIVEKATVEQERINAEYIKAQPFITEATQLEQQCVSDSRTYNEQIEGIKRLCDERDKCTAIISVCKKEQEILAKEAEEKKSWLDRHALYSKAIPMIPSIIVNIQFIDNEQKSIKIKSESLGQALNLLKSYEQQLDAARKSEEVLKQTMSSEIALLRKRLVDGVPCPVCGSRHHEVVEIAENLLEEKQLEKAKEENRILIEHIEKSLSNCRIEIETLQTVIGQHKDNISQYNSINLDYLADIENAQDLLEDKNVSLFLKELSSNWNSYKERLVSIENEVNLCINRQFHNQNRFEEIEKELCGIREKNTLLKASIEKCKERISSILGNWKSSEEIQQYYNKAISAANNSFITATEQRSKIDIERNRLKGQISEKKKQLTENAAKIELSTQKVNDFLSARNDGMDFTTLNALLTTDYSAIDDMRAKIDFIEKETTAATVTLAERKQNLLEHSNAANKPEEYEDAAYIRNETIQLEKSIEEINEQIIQINAQLLKDEKNRTEFDKYSEEYDAKVVQKTHWSTLNEIFGAAEGDKLMKLAQGYTLDILLDVANIHLADMTKRYKLARIANDSLGIKVIDLDMMSESRSAYTLSGGETFIVSLALSLALSSLSSNKMRIESLFIDEGFGALDKNTLQTALMMLEKLHSRGLKIGVISHLSEMLEQIPVKVNVARISPGRSKIEVTENRK